MQHIGIAEHLLESLVELARELENFYELVRGASDSGLEQRALAAKSSWVVVVAQQQAAGAAALRARGRREIHLHRGSSG